MKLPRRQFLHLAAGAAALPAVSQHRAGASLSDRGRCAGSLSALPAGGPADIVARLMGQWLSERLGQPFVIENRPGAGSNIADRSGRARAARRLYAPHGRPRRMRSTRRSTTSSISISSATSRQSRAISRGPLVMVVNPSVPAKTVPEFIAYAKANPRQDQHGIGRQWNARRMWPASYSR